MLLETEVGRVAVVRLCFRRKIKEKRGGVGENTGSFFDLNKKSLRGTAFSNLLSEARER